MVVRMCIFLNTIIIVFMEIFLHVMIAVWLWLSIKVQTSRICSRVQLLPKEIKVVKDERMLQDRHIDAACALLQTVSWRSRTADTTPRQSLSFNQTDPPFVQIMHAGGIHWNTVVAVINHTVKSVWQSLPPQLWQLHIHAVCCNFEVPTQS